MVDIVQKVKFKGEKNQIFSIGNESFPAGVWKVAKPGQIAILVEADITNMFEFNPPLNFDTFTAMGEEKPAEDEKPKRRRRRKKQETEEADE